MTTEQAIAIYWPELRAVTVDTWTAEDLAEEPAFVAIAADVEAGRITPAVLEEITSRLDCDWCTGRLQLAAWTILACYGQLEEYSPAAVYSRRLRTRVLGGKRWIVG